MQYDSTTPAEPTEIPLAEAVDHDAYERHSRSRSPSRLHPISLVFVLLTRVKSYLVPAILAVVVRGDGRTFLVGLIIIGFVFALAVDVVRFVTLRYQIADGELIVRQGLLNKQQRNVPLGRIQNIDLVQNLFHRVFKVAEVRIETASGTEPEAILKVISLLEVDRLRDQVNHANYHSKSDATGITHEHVEHQSREERPLLKISTAELILLGLIGNRGTIMMMVAAGFVYEFRIHERFNRKWAEDWFEGLQQFDFATRFIVGFLAMLFFFAFLKCLSAVWFVLRFHGYRLTTNGRDLRISAGLITKVSATVPLRRIQFISVQESVLARLIGRASIRIETAGGAGKESEDPSSSIARRWFVPIIKKADLNHVLGELRAGLVTDVNQYAWISLHIATAKRLVRKAVVLSVLATVFIAIPLKWWAVPIGILIATILNWHAIQFPRHAKYARFANGVCYRSGVFQRKMSFTFFDKIQSVRLAQSPFDRKWKMARMEVDTAAAGPADHNIQIPYLDCDFARQEFDQVAELSSTKALQMA